MLSTHIATELLPHPLTSSLKSILSFRLDIFIVARRVRCRFRIIGPSRFRSRRASFQPRLFPALQGPQAFCCGTAAPSTAPTYSSGWKPRAGAGSRLDCVAGDSRVLVPEGALEGGPGSGWRVTVTLWSLTSGLTPRTRGAGGRASRLGSEGVTCSGHKQKNSSRFWRASGVVLL